MAEPDLDTLKVLQEGEKAARFVLSDDWIWAKAKLTSLMSAVDSISLLPLSKTDSELGAEVRANSKAQKIVQAWFSEIEGTAESHKMNLNALKDDNPLITHLEK